MEIEFVESHLTGDGVFGGDWTASYAPTSITQVTPVPEPATVEVMGGGLALLGVGGVVRRRLALTM